MKAHVACLILRLCLVGGTHGVNDSVSQDRALNPEDAEAWFNLGNAGGGTVAGRHYDAQHCYEQALALDPEDAVAWFNLGAAGGGTVAGRHYDAQHCFEQALALDPAYADAWSDLGHAGGGTVAGRHYDTSQCFGQELRYIQGASASDIDAILSRGANMFMEDAQGATVFETLIFDHRYARVVSSHMSSHWGALMYLMILSGIGFSVSSWYFGRSRTFFVARPAQCLTREATLSILVVAIIDQIVWRALVLRWMSESSGMTYLCATICSHFGFQRAEKLAIWNEAHSRTYFKSYDELGTWSTQLQATVALAIIPCLYAGFWFGMGLIGPTYCFGESAGNWMFSTFTDRTFLVLASSLDFYLNFLYWMFSGVGQLDNWPLYDWPLYLCVAIEFSIICTWMVKFSVQPGEPTLVKPVSSTDLLPGDQIMRTYAFGFRGLTHHGIFVGKMRIQSDGTIAFGEVDGVVDVNGPNINWTSLEDFRFGVQGSGASLGNLVSRGYAPIEFRTHQQLLVRRYREVEQGSSGHDVAERALHLISTEYTYGVFDRNCESFCTSCRRGTYGTKQGLMAKACCKLFWLGSLPVVICHLAVAVVLSTCMKPIARQIIKEVGHPARVVMSLYGSVLALAPVLLYASWSLIQGRQGSSEIQAFDDHIVTFDDENV